MKDRKLSNIGVKYHSKFMTIDRIFTSKFNSVLAQSLGIAWLFHTETIQKSIESKLDWIPNDIKHTIKVCIDEA